MRLRRRVRLATGLALLPLLGLPGSGGLRLLRLGLLRLRLLGLGLLRLRLGLVDGRGLLHGPRLLAAVLRHVLRLLDVPHRLLPAQLGHRAGLLAVPHGLLPALLRDITSVLAVPHFLRRRLLALLRLAPTARRLLTPRGLLGGLLRRAVRRIGTLGRTHRRPSSKTCGAAIKAQGSDQAQSRACP
jgi:hypothetical protein